MSRVASRWLACVALVMWPGFLVGVGQAEGTAAAERLALIIARTLSYERTLSDTAGSDVGIILLYDAKQPTSRAEADALLAGFRGMKDLTVHGVPFRAESRAYSTFALAQAEREGADVLVVCRGLEAQAAEVAQVARRGKLRTIGLSSRLAELATSLAVYSEGDKLVVAVNQRHAAAEGLKLNSQLLRVAKLL